MNSALLLVVSFTAGQFTPGAPARYPLHGSLADAAGVPITTSVEVRFSLYRTATETTPVWNETQTLLPLAGVFDAMLGDVNPLPASLFAQHNAWWLGVSVGNDQEMERIALGSVPFAAVAQVCMEVPAHTHDAATLTGAVPPAALPDAVVLGGQMCPSGQRVDGLSQTGDLLCSADRDALGQVGCAAPGQVATWAGSGWTCADTQATTEAQVDAWVANNGYALAMSLAPVAVTGSFADLASVPPDLADGDDVGLTGTGTTTHLARWSGPDTLGSSSFLDTASGAGVGAASSAAQFTVQSSGAVLNTRSTVLVTDSTERGTLTIQSAADKPTDLVFKNNSAPTFAVTTRASTENNEFRLYRFPGGTFVNPVVALAVPLDANRLGVGTTAPTEGVDVLGAALRSRRDATQYVDVRSVDTTGAQLVARSPNTSRKPLVLRAVHDATGTASGESTMGFEVGLETAPTRVMTLRESGAVGIGTTNPASALDVAGTATANVMASDEYRLRTAQPRTLGLPAAQFVGVRDGLYSGLNLWVQYGSAVSSPESGAVTAPVMLPRGALMVGLTCRFTSNHNGQASIALYRGLHALPENLGLLAILSNQVIGNTAPSFETYSAFISSGMVDNESYFYVARVVMEVTSMGTSNYVKFFGCTISYSVDHLEP